MARGQHWWNEPPWWAWVTMAVSLVALIVLVPVTLNRSAPDAGASLRTTPTSPPADGAPSSAAPSSSQPAGPTGDEATRVLVIGDVDTAGFDAGSVGWPAVLESRLGDVELTVATTGDTGYYTRGADGDATLGELVQDADLTGVDVVVLMGSRFDEGGVADRVNFFAGVAIGSIVKRAPDAELVVIGPAWPTTAPPAGVRNNRGVIGNAAETAGVEFVDPLAEGWLADTPGLVGPDGVHLTAAADTYLADRIEPVIRRALAS